MSNLIPTPRTDKNGVTVTRHMKPEASGSLAEVTKKEFPAPGTPYLSEDYADWMEERQQLRDQIFDLAQDPEGRGPNRPDKLTKTLSVIHDSAYLQRALEVAHAIKDSGSNSETGNYGHEWWNFAEGLRKRKPIEAAHRNLELIRKADRIGNGYWAIVELHGNLSSRLPTTEDGYVDRMDNHLFAYNTVMKHPGFGDARDWEKYADEYAPLVIKYPDYCAQLCDYLKERGGPASFSENGFAEYLNTTTPLAGGAL